MKSITELPRASHSLNTYNPDLAIVIIGRNDVRWLPSLFQSIVIYGRGALVIYIDNASRDVSVAVALKYLPQPNVILNTRNIGYAAAANQGARIARVRGSHRLLILNPDTRLMETTLDNLKLGMEKFPDAILGPRQYPYESRPDLETENSIQHLINTDTEDLTSSDHFSDGQAEPIAVNYVQGSALALTLDTFERLGGFVEAFHTYSEDKELARRARSLGMLVAILPSSRIHHYHTNLTRQPIRRGYRKYRSGFLYVLMDPDANLRDRCLGCLLQFRTRRDLPVPVLTFLLPAAFSAALVTYVRVNLVRTKS